MNRALLKREVEQILHVPGNYSGGILEMAMVFDCSLDKETVTRQAQEVTAALKVISPVFRNVRLNAITWKKEKEFQSEVTALPILQMGRYFDGYEYLLENKDWGELLSRLKTFHARSKLILVFTDQDFRVRDTKAAGEAMQPFLYRKLLVLSKDRIITGKKLMGLLSENSAGKD